MTSIEHRLTKLEVRQDYSERMGAERHLIISSHARRLADNENKIHDLAVVQSHNVERLTKVEQTAAEVREDRQRRKHQRALIQWAISVAMGLAVLAGMLTKSESGMIQSILGGWPPHL